MLGYHCIVDMLLCFTLRLDQMEVAAHIHAPAALLPEKNPTIPAG
jgi:hypothetical protein